MIKPVRFALFGIGGIGAYHRAAIEGREAAGAARLVAVADPWADRLSAQKSELESRGVRWHMDYRDLLRLEPDIDAAVIATPIPFHFDMAMACLDRGLKIHLEKPPVPLLSQFRDLLAADSRQSISVGFQMIGSQCTQLLKEAISEGRLGTINEICAGGSWPRLDSYYSRASWAGKMSLDGAPVFDGPATNAFAHLIHNIMYFAAPGREEFDIPAEVEGELYRARPIESYDTASLRGCFASGIQFSVAVSHATETALPFRIEVRGSKGWARISEDGAKLDSSIGLSCDCPQSTQQLLDVNYLNFIEVLAGRSQRFTTRLADTRGYVCATNAMLLSSGGIHDIAADSIRQYHRNGETGFDVQNLREAIEESILSGRLFHEQSLPWATAKPAPISLPLDPAIPVPI